MTIRSPDDLIASFRCQFSAETAGNVVFLRDKQPIFVELCQAFDSALGKVKRGFQWTRVQTDQFKFHVDPGTRSSDFAALCRQAKSRVLKCSAMFAITVSYSKDLKENSFTCEPHSSKLCTPESSSKEFSPDELIAALPGQFAGRHVGLPFHRGWQDLFSRLCLDIVAALVSEKRGFHCVQVKEKGTASTEYHQITRNGGGFIYSPIILSISSQTVQ